MKKRNLSKIILLLVVVFGILAVNYIGPVDIDISIESLRVWVKGSNISYLIFLSLWILRLVLFIPGVTLMLLGGLIFSPMEAFILSMLGLIISDSLVFAIGKSSLFEGLRNKLKNKYEDIFILIQEYNYKLLALGVLCPVAPTDVICYLSSYLGLGYRKFLITFVLANLPATFLYSFLGTSFSESIYNTLFIVIMLAVTSIVSILEWNKLKASLDDIRFSRNN